MINKRKIARTINTKFSGQSENEITLTYDAGESKDEAAAKKDLLMFFRRIKYLRKKEGLPNTSYSAVTDKASGRVHHHIQVQGLSVEKAKELWPHGAVQLSKKVISSV